MGTAVYIYEQLNPGTVHRAPDDIPGVGRFAIIADPQGATIALFKGASEAPPPTAPGTTDREAAFDFYSKLFGWKRAESIDMGPMGIFQIFSTGSEPMSGGMMTKPEACPAPFWLYYFNTSGIDAAAERVKAAGGEICNGLLEVPGGAWIEPERDTACTC
jgi:uncharacterized protein